MKSTCTETDIALSKFAAKLSEKKIEPGNPNRRAKYIIGALIVGVLVTIGLVITLSFMFAPETEAERLTPILRVATEKEDIVGAKRAMLKENRHRLHVDL